MCSSSHCFIIPPYILEALARQGNVSCKRALNDTRRILEKRNTALNNLLFRSLQEEGRGDRLVYDSGNRYEQRQTLVRGEEGRESDDQMVNVAYDNSGYVRDYFKSTFNLNSMDDKGMSVISNVHYGVKYNNAYWDGDEMTYGDGDGVEFGNFASAIDVVAHELTHGVTQFLANLEYYGQSGALNEHFSDVFATIIKQKFQGQQPSEADWLIGDAIVTGNFPGKAIRSLKAPGTSNEFDIQPDHMDNYYKGSSDNQGVHINSGIPNKAFYLAAMELGMEDAQQIWFHCLKALWRTAGFSDMLSQILTICGQLSAEGKIKAEARQVVADSFSAVGLTIAVV
jgi:Zn-dependent metalloprotease